jgi:hypothetical protein
VVCVVCLYVSGVCGVCGVFVCVWCEWCVWCVCVCRCVYVCEGCVKRALSRVLVMLVSLGECITIIDTIIHHIQTNNYTQLYTIYTIIHNYTQFY